MKLSILRFIGVACCALIHSYSFANQLKIVSTNYHPYNYEVDGEPTGYSAKIITAFLREFHKMSGDDVTTEFYPWARSFHQAKTTPNTLIYSIARTPERENDFYWIGRLLPMPVYLFKHKSRKDIVFSQRHDTKLWTVGGVLSGGPTQCIEEQGYNVIHKAADLSIQLKLLAKGRLDLLVFDTASIKSSLARLNFSAEDFEPVLFLPDCSFDLYVALNVSSDAGLLKRVQLAWQKINRDGVINEVRTEFESKYQPFM